MRQNLRNLAKLNHTKARAQVSRSSTNSFTNLQILNTRFSMIQQFKDCSNLQNSQNSQLTGPTKQMCRMCRMYRMQYEIKSIILYIYIYVYIYIYYIYIMCIQYIYIYYKVYTYRIYIYISLYIIWYTKVSSRRTSRVPPLLLHAALRAAQFGLPHCAARPRPEGCCGISAPIAENRKVWNLKLKCNETNEKVDRWLIIDDNNNI